MITTWGVGSISKYWPQKCDVLNLHHQNLHKSRCSSDHLPQTEVEVEGWSTELSWDLHIHAAAHVCVFACVHARIWEHINKKRK